MLGYFKEVMCCTGGGGGGGVEQDKHSLSHHGTSMAAADKVRLGSFC